jgi:hypothetical protein
VSGKPDAHGEEEMHVVMRLGIVTAALVSLNVAIARGDENYDSWAPLQNPFESTGGGGIMIDGYNPVVTGNKCVTGFTATEPGGKVYHNTIEFDAVPIRGGILCTNGRWQAVDGSASGTTPFRVFIKDGIRRRSP